MSISTTTTFTGSTSGGGGGGVAYTRWGRTTCPAMVETELVYEGKVVGSRYDQAGSAEYLCLHNQPQFRQTITGQQSNRARLYGVKYSSIDSSSSLRNNRFYDLPCALCYTPSRSTSITIPGRRDCPSSWTKEYQGYLMTEHSLSNRNSRVPICVDVEAETVAGSSSRTFPSLLHFIETTCTGIQCPPYKNGAEISCVVCTK